MNRLVLVPCVVVASYVAVASYIVWPTIVYEDGGPRSALNIPTSVANRGEIRKDGSSPTEQTSPVLVSHEAPNKAAPAAKSTTAVLPDDHDLTWVTVLLPARVHTGPSVDTPITQFYAVGTPLHARRYWNDWIEVSEPGTLKSGWIYRKYLGAISNPEQSKIASQEAQEERPAAQRVSVKRYAKAAPAKRYAKAVPVKRYANAVRPSKRSMQAKQIARGGRTEMASLLQRAFSGY
jgi:hypothetical protein